MPTMFDPPEGWRYGFPKPYDFKPSHPNLPGEEHAKEWREWLMDLGYPQHLVSLAENHSRYWDEP